MSSDAELITAELFKADEKYDLALTHKNNGLWIRCPFHSGGRERTPSMQITIDDSSSFFQKCKCHGCGWGPKHYNEIAEHFGLIKTDKNFKAVGVKKLSFRDKLKYKQENDEYTATFRKSTFDWPEDREWRGIPGKIVVRNKAALTDVRHDLEEPRLIFPVTVWGEEKGVIYAMIRDPKRDSKTGKKIETPYLNSSGDWKEKTVFGFDRARRLLKKYPNKPLWIVEGPRDKLWLETAGCIAVSAMGSSFSKEKAELVKLLNPHRILVGTDADEAGDKLASNIYDLLNGYIPLTKIDWPDGKDPCDISLKRLRQINAKFSMAA